MYRPVRRILCPIYLANPGLTFSFLLFVDTKDRCTLNVKEVAMANPIDSLIILLAGVLVCL